MHTKQELTAAMDSVFEERKGIRINRPALVQLTLQQLGANPNEWHKTQDAILDLLQERVASGDLLSIKGTAGGVMRKCDASEDWRSYAAKMDQHTKKVHDAQAVVNALAEERPLPPGAKTTLDRVQASAIKVLANLAKLQSKSEVVIGNANDHTCSSCGNTACNKTEKSCWKCGSVI